MAVGRISGPLLAQNLFRDDIPLGFYNTSSSESPVLYLDVSSGKVGIRKDNPVYSLDIEGTVNADNLRILYSGPGTGQGTIGQITINSGTISTTVGAITIEPSGSEPINLNSDLNVTGAATFTANIQSTSSATGTLIIQGGIGVLGDNVIYGKTTLQGGVTPPPIGIGTATLMIEGGAYVERDLRVDGIIYGQISTTSVTTNAINAEFINVTDSSSGLYFPLLGGATSGYVAVQGNQNFTFDLPNGKLIVPNLAVNSTTNALSTDTGSLVISGGIGIDKDIFVGGKITSKSTDSSALLVDGGAEIAKEVYIGGQLYILSTASSTSSTTGALIVDGGASIKENLNVSGNVTLGTTNTDVLTINATVNSDLIPTVTNQYDLGSTSSAWADAYFENLYGNFLKTTTGPLTISPANNLLEINANVRINGDKPLGTAPVITNILYVNMDGDDTNDGRADDPSRACRTIGGAIKSPYYQPGTAIRVSSGRYLENNPLVLLPYTSVIGTDLRTTFIEPINKTQDLFHVQSGCYLTGMQFSNGRSGVLPGVYTNGFNRGAYAIAFPPQVGGNKIDVFHSPYIQNCTNQSGPWLKDGTMFRPNQTVQVPLAVGTGTWAEGTYTLTISISTGTISPDMSVNSGQQNPGFFNARTLLLANKAFIQEQVVTYVNQTYPTFEYNQAKCFRDVGIIVENVAYDSAFGGNEKSVEAGLAYYNGVVSVIAGQETQTIAAINYIDTLAQSIVTNSSTTDLLFGTGTYVQIFNNKLIGGEISQSSITKNINIITTIINSGTNFAPSIYKSTGPDYGLVSAEILLEANRTFIQEETIAWIAENYPTFTYNQSLCYRDAGLIVDAVSQDILLGGNAKSIEAGISYWDGVYSEILGQESTTTAAINHIKDISLLIINNQSVTPSTNNTASQVINTFFENGILASNSLQRNFAIINDIIINGIDAAPISYQGGGLFAAIGISGNDVKIAPKILSTNSLGGDLYEITLDKPTVGFGTNATLYFGETSIFPKLDSEIPEEWEMRKFDPLGGMGGMLVDGDVVSTRSPIASMVLNAYTQVSQGGRGIHIINNGYAQLVSIFTIFCNVSVEVDRGGIASITNSNSNFGDICLVSRGYGKRDFSGTIFNPNNPAFIPNGEFYPNGYFPQNAQILAFVPDSANRPHISLVMEVEPPDNYINQQGFKGFLTANPTLDVLTTGSITITGIDTRDIAIGQTVDIRDQFGFISENNGMGNPYVSSGTIVTNIGYQSVTLNKALTGGGGEPGNTNFFNIYFSGKAYYTVLSSEVYPNPTPIGQSLIPGQTAAELDGLTYLNTVVQNIIGNASIIPYSSGTQIVLPSVTGGNLAGTFISDRIDIIKDIVQNGVGVAPAITRTGTITDGAGSAITLINANKDFIADEIVAEVDNLYPSLIYDKAKCRRDVKLILQQLIYDLETGGNYYSVYAGLSYWSRAGTYHLIQLGENVSNPDLFPDGVTINFYQRSYISAAGYTFEYVGAGMNYGSLPQVGRADPVQTKEVLQLDGGKVFFTSTDQNGDFRIGPELVISQATGVLSGRTFTRSLFANLTPFILAVEGSL